MKSRISIINESFSRGMDNHLVSVHEEYFTEFTIHQKKKKKKKAGNDGTRKYPERPSKI